MEISHKFKDESLEEKARWFQSLTMEQRIQNFCDYIELALALNPKLGDKPLDKSIKGRVQVITRK